MTIDFGHIISQSLLTVVKFWPLWVVVLCLLIIRFAFDQLGYEIENWVIRRKFRQGEQWRTGREMIRWLRDMKSDDFEKYIGEIFRRLGYDVKVTGGSYDGGVDVIAEKDNRKHYIQCKRYSAKNEVGVGAIRDFYGALADRLANGKGYFVTTGKFTLEAERFAEDKPIELVDSQRLLQYIRLSGIGNPQSLDSKTLECPKCGGKMVLRNGRFGPFYGCINYPKCKYTTSE